MCVCKCRGVVLLSTLEEMPCGTDPAAVSLSSSASFAWPRCSFTVHIYIHIRTDKPAANNKRQHVQSKTRNPSLQSPRRTELSADQTRSLYTIFSHLSYRVRAVSCPLPFDGGARLRRFPTPRASPAALPPTSLPPSILGSSYLCALTATAHASRHGFSHVTTRYLIQ